MKQEESKMTEKMAKSLLDNGSSEYQRYPVVILVTDDGTLEEAQTDPDSWTPGRFATIIDSRHYLYKMWDHPEAYYGGFERHGARWLAETVNADIDAGELVTMGTSSAFIQLDRPPPGYV